MKEYVIYKTTNLVNGKFYVGKDEYNNPEYLGSGKLLHKAICKYGKENFKKEILEYCNELNHGEREVYWINELNSFSPNGYNIMNGSFGGDTYTHHPNKELYSNRISKSLLGKNHSKTHNEKISISLKGGLNPSKQDWVKEKISNSRRGKSIAEENSMYNISRKRENLKNLGVELKGDKWEYLRNKIQCKNLETGENIILDGIKEVLEYLHISKNKYYTHIKTGVPIKEKFICVKI